MTPGRKRRLVFLYRWSRRDMGGSQMRVQQLSAHMTRHFGDQYDVRLQPIARGERIWSRVWAATQPPGSVFFFSKNAITGWPPETLERLRRKAAAVLADYVDLKQKYVWDWGVDCHVTTSVDAATRLRARMEQRRASGHRVEGEVATVLHNYDVALDAITRNAPKNRLSVGFLGSRAAAATTPEIEPMITFLDGSGREAFLRDVSRIGSFNCHYCVRTPMPEEEGRSIRPFTKGITAAACDAVIITNRQTDDAEALLGEDYPFMLDDVSAETINAGMSDLSDAFGGPKWTGARERVMALKERTSHASVARQLHEAIQSVI